MLKCDINYIAILDGGKIMINITKITPRYAETDQMGIIHHSVYAIYYEQARTEYFNKIGIRYDEIEKQGMMTPLVELKCKYRKPAYYNQEIEIRTKLIELTPVKFTLEYDIYDKEENLINIGKTTLAWSDAKTFKIINLKKEKPNMYEKLEALVEK